MIAACDFEIKPADCNSASKVNDDDCDDYAAAAAVADGADAKADI